MESIELDLDDIFDREAVGEDEDVGVQVPLPDLDDDEGPMRESEQTQNDEDDGGVVANLQRLSKGAAKKKVMRPQPKLDADRLKGERGLAVLPKIFENVKFKGKGYEGEDLKLMMGKLEHWAHRLFPKMPFDDFIERMEKLGGKKPVQNCVKRIRLGMPVLDDDYVVQYDNVDAAATEDGPIMNPEQPEDVDMDAEDAFEEMIRQEREAQQKRKEEEQNGNIDLNSDEDHPGPSNRFLRSPESVGSPQRNDTSLTPQKQPDSPETRATQKPKPPDSPETQTTQTQKQLDSPAKPAIQAQKGMTPDLKAKIEENKRRALERRAARLGVPVSSLLPPKPAQTPDPVACRSPEPPGQSRPKLPSPSPIKSKPDKSNNRSISNKLMSPPLTSPNTREKRSCSTDPSNFTTDSKDKDNDVLQTEDEILNTLELSISDDDQESVSRLNSHMHLKGKENKTLTMQDSVNISNSKDFNDFSPTQPSRENNLLIEKTNVEGDQPKCSTQVESMDSEILPVYN